MQTPGQRQGLSRPRPRSCHGPCPKTVHGECVRPLRIPPGGVRGRGWWVSRNRVREINGTALQDNARWGSEKAVNVYRIDGFSGADSLRESPKVADSLRESWRRQSVMTAFHKGSPLVTRGASGLTFAPYHRFGGFRSAPGP